MTIREAKSELEEVILRSNECQQPFRCRWHRRFKTDRERCPYERRYDCDCHRYARALRALLRAAE
jgi:hypothetical protein